MPILITLDEQLIMPSVAHHDKCSLVGLNISIETYSVV